MLVNWSVRIGVCVCLRDSEELEKERKYFQMMRFIGWFNLMEYIFGYKYNNHNNLS